MHLNRTVGDSKLLRRASKIQDWAVQGLILNFEAVSKIIPDNNDWERRITKKRLVSASLFLLWVIE